MHNRLAQITDSVTINPLSIKRDFGTNHLQYKWKQDEVLMVQLQVKYSSVFVRSFFIGSIANSSRLVSN